jgi:hypothetical protein
MADHRIFNRRSFIRGLAALLMTVCLALQAAGQPEGDSPRIACGCR